jgi:hypothetical protein
MKRILLTSTALVAFAGAAAADISFSGTAEFSYNVDAAGTVTNTSDTEITAAASQALNNGYTASVSFTIDPEGAAGEEIAAGDITVANDSSSVTYHIGADGAGAAHLGDHKTMQSAVTNVFGDADTAEVTANARVSGSLTMAGATVGVSMNDAGDYQLGVSTDLGGTTLSAGFDGATGGEYGIMLGGSASSVDYELAFGSNGADTSYGLSASTTAGGADITLAFGDLGYEIGASMPLGAATVGVKLTDTNATAGNGWEITAATALDAVDVSFKLAQAEGATDTTWEMTAGYSAGAVAVSATFDSASDSDITASYDMGNGLVAYAGVLNDNDGTVDATYAGVEYDLGGGAALTVSNATLGAGYTADTDFGQDYAAGTTVSVSFSF